MLSHQRQALRVALFRLPVVLLLLFFLVACSENDRPLESPVTLQGDIFGTYYQVTVADALTQGQAKELEKGFVAELDAIDASMSTWKEDSELSRFNRVPVGEWQTLSAPLMEVMDISQRVSDASHGAFDVTVGKLVNLWSFGPEARPKKVPSNALIAERLDAVGMQHLELDNSELKARRLKDIQVDLSGVAKGYATDRVAAYLSEQGYEHYLVNLGGEIKVRGYRDAESEHWRIGVEVPVNGQPTAEQILPLENISVATSGDYRNYFEQNGQRYSHTIDPRDGQPIHHRMASVTIVHDANAEADAWATAMSVLGEREGLEAAIRENIAVLMLVREDGHWQSLVSPAFAEYFGEALINDMNARIVGQVKQDLPPNDPAE
ncbi:FAD:protein FMN transferase [Halomonas halocynthiae]|uniref:FAD:protein FMN transferase n=1 Tax=Halomonas halocynthiae TaxID=176290 RepID=UPI00041C815B|nr:FAD:protein FMN transferase [Halomonas halocynthiae]